MRKRLIPLLLALALIIALGTVSALADSSDDCGENLAWEYSNGTLTITGSGEMEDYETKETPWYAFREDITEIVLPDGLTKIGKSAFLETAITDIDIPDTVRYIGENAFWNCNRLSGVTVPASVIELGTTAFFGNFDVGFERGSRYFADSDGVIYDKWTDTVVQAPSDFSGEYNFPRGVKAIGDFAFYGCGLSGELVIPNSVETIGHAAFYGTSISSLSIGRSVTEIGSSSFAGCTQLAGDLIIPNSVVTIGDSAFSQLDTDTRNKLSSVSFGSGVKSVGKSAFLGCTSLTSLSLNEGLEVIGQYAFSGCSVLTGSLAIPSTVAEIGQYAFNGCTTLNGTLTIGGALEMVDGSIFPSNSGFTGVVIREGTTEIANNAFDHWESLKSVEIPASVTEIGDTAFGYCSALASVTGGEGVKAIGESAFRQTAITQAILPDGLESIGKYAYADCKLIAISIPDSVESIGYAAFSYNYDVTSVKVPVGKIEYGSTENKYYIFSFYNNNDEGYSKLDTVVIGSAPDNVSPRELFSNSWKNLKVLVIGSGVNTLNDWAVYHDSETSYSTKLESGLYPSTMTFNEARNNLLTEKATRYTLSTATQIGSEAIHMLTFATDNPIISKITYASSNPYAISVDSTGKITAVGFPGEKAVITASYDGCAFAELELTISGSSTADGELAISGPDSVIYGQSYEFSCAALEGAEVGYYQDDARLAAAPKNVGEYTAIISGTTEEGKTVLLEKPFKITPATLIITASDVEIAQGSEEAPELTYSVRGLVSGDSLITEPSLSCTYNINRPGTYDITVSGANAGANYTIVYVDGELTVKGLPTPSLPDTHQINVTQPVGGSVDTNFSNASAGSVITVTATPEEGYTLLYVTVDGEKIDGLSFKMPDHAVTVSAVFTRGLPFTDVADGGWFYDYIAYVYANGLMEGVSATEFNPDGTMTRAMFWAVLARIDGETVTGVGWIDEARAWAVTSGVSDGTNADAEITRQEMVTMLYRFAGSPVVTGSLSGYTDAASVASWAADAMTWAVTSGVITGASETALAPGANATRAQAAAILMRFAEA